MSVQLNHVEAVSHSEVFKQFLNGERGFVREVFNLQVLNHLRKVNGLEPLTKAQLKGDPMYDHTTYPASVAKYADILLEWGENSAMYVEVMDSSHPQWDGSHHEQYILKQYRLEKRYDLLETFVVSFESYPQNYLNDFNDDGTFAVVMKITSGSNGYNFTFESENKKGAKAMSRRGYETPSEVVESLKRWATELEEKCGRTPSVHSIDYSYLPVTSGIGGKKSGTIQLKAMDRKNDNLGLKLFGSLYTKPDYSFVPDNKDQIAEQLSEQTGLQITHNNAASDVVFWLNIGHTEYDRVESVESAIKAFAEICGIKE
ncbi:MAG: hypothetical protein ACO306_04925 [Flavobacteriaceae bacterium]